MTGDLFARARRTDPETSHIAAEKIEASGKAATDRQLALYLVKRYPSSTAWELARFAGHPDRHRVSRRLTELRQGGLIQNDGKRKCRVSGALMMTWREV